MDFDDDDDDDNNDDKEKHNDPVCRVTMSFLSGAPALNDGERVSNHHRANRGER